MLLINLFTIYQGRIPTLRHTQLHVETLARSHPKYVFTGELDTPVTHLIRQLTNHAHRTTRNTLTRKMHTLKQPPPPITNTPHPYLSQHSPPVKNTNSHPYPEPAHSPLNTKTHLRKPANATLPPHTTIPCTQTPQTPPALNPTSNLH